MPFLSHKKPCFHCNIAITNFLVSNTCEIRFHDVISQSTVHMYYYAKIVKHGRPTWPNEYVLNPYFLILFVGFGLYIFTADPNSSKVFSIIAESLGLSSIG